MFIIASNTNCRSDVGMRTARKAACAFGLLRDGKAALAMTARTLRA